MIKRFFLITLLFFTQTTQIRGEGSPKTFWLGIAHPVLIAVPVGIISGLLARLMAQRLEDEPRSTIKKITKIALCYFIIPLTRQQLIDSISDQAEKNNTPFNDRLASILARAADWITYLKLKPVPLN